MFGSCDHQSENRWIDRARQYIFVHLFFLSFFLRLIFFSGSVQVVEEGVVVCVRLPADYTKQLFFIISREKGIWFQGIDLVTYYLYLKLCMQVTSPACAHVFFLLLPPLLLPNRIRSHPCPARICGIRNQRLLFRWSFGGLFELFPGREI